MAGRAFSKGARPNPWGRAGKPYSDKRCTIAFAYLGACVRDFINECHTTGSASVALLEWGVNDAWYIARTGRIASSSDETAPTQSLAIAAILQRKHLREQKIKDKLAPTPRRKR